MPAKKYELKVELTLKELMELYGAIDVDDATRPASITMYLTTREQALAKVKEAVQKTLESLDAS